MLSGFLTPGLIIELVVMLLLAVTTGYCIILNKKLKNLRESQGELRQTIYDLNQATMRAEGAIEGLKVTTNDAEARLSSELEKAKMLTEQFGALNRVGEHKTQNVTPFRKAS